MSSNSNDKNIISSSDLSKHNMTRYEFKKLDTDNLNDIDDYNADHPHEIPAASSNYIPSNNVGVDKELIDTLLAKSDDLSNLLHGFQDQFNMIQEQLSKKEELARQEGFKEGELKAQLSFRDELEKEKERITKTVVTLNETIENIKSQVVNLESELSSIALDIAKEVIIKEIDENSAKIAALISKELLQSMSSNLNVIIKVNPVDFEYLDSLLKNKQNIKIKSDDAIQKGGVVIISDNGSIDGNIMSRYHILKQSVLENFRD